MGTVASSVRSVAVAVALFLLVYLPLAGVVGILEGALYGRWGLTFDDFIYQLGAYAAFMLPWLAPAGALAAPLTLLLIRSVRTRSPTRPRLWLALLGPTVVVASAALVLSISGGEWLAAPIMLATLPVAFLGGASVFAMLCAHYALPAPRASSALAV